MVLMGVAYREKVRSARMGTGTEVSSSSTPSLFFSTYLSRTPTLRICGNVTLRHSSSHCPTHSPYSHSPCKEGWTRGHDVDQPWRAQARPASWRQTLDVCTSPTLQRMTRAKYQKRYLFKHLLKSELGRISTLAARLLVSPVPSSGVSGNKLPDSSAVRTKPPYRKLEEYGAVSHPLWSSLLRL